MTTHDNLLNELNQHRDQIEQGGGAARLNDGMAPGVFRPRLVAALDFLRDKAASSPPKKHGNILL